MVAAVGDLEVAQDLSWQRREWFIHRVGWFILAIFILVAALGVLGGDGPLREARAGDSTLVTYDRFAHFASPTELSVIPPAGAVANGEVEVAVDRGYLANFEVRAVTPQPQSVELRDEELVYSFLVADPPGQVDFALEPREAGLQSGAVRVGAATTEFDQVVYP